MRNRFKASSISGVGKGVGRCKRCRQGVGKLGVHTPLPTPACHCNTCCCVAGVGGVGFFRRKAIAVSTATGTGSTQSPANFCNIEAVLKVFRGPPSITIIFFLLVLSLCLSAKES